MALTDYPLKKGTHQRDRSKDKRATEVGYWSDKQKMDMVQSYLVTGNLALSARMLNIPEITVRKWKQSQWWKELEGQIKEQDAIELSAQLKNIIQKSLTIVADRLENGDYFYDQKSGAIVRKPVNLRDVNKVAVDLVTKRQQIEQAPQQHILSEDSLEAKLIKLAEKFAEIAAKKKDEVRTLEAEVIEIKET